MQVSETRMFEVTEERKRIFRLGWYSNRILRPIAKVSLWVAGSLAIIAIWTSSILWWISLAMVVVFVTCIIIKVMLELKMEARLLPTYTEQELEFLSNAPPGSSFKWGEDDEYYQRILKGEVKEDPETA